MDGAGPVLTVSLDERIELVLPTANGNDFGAFLDQARCHRSTDAQGCTNPGKTFSEPIGSICPMGINLTIRYCTAKQWNEYELLNIITLHQGLLESGKSLD